MPASGTLDAACCSSATAAGSPIEALLASGRAAIVIVGLGHVVGEDSVVEMLRARGHGVRRLTAELPSPCRTDGLWPPR